MTRTRSILLAGILALLLGGCASSSGPVGEAGAPDAAASRASEILALDDERFAAMTAGDRAAIERLLADDLTYVHSNGTVDDKASLLEALSSGKLRYLEIDP